MFGGSLPTGCLRLHELAGYAALVSCGALCMSPNARGSRAALRVLDPAANSAGDGGGDTSGLESDSASSDSGDWGDDSSDTNSVDDGDNDDDNDDDHDGGDDDAGYGGEYGPGGYEHAFGSGSDHDHA